VQFPRPQGVGSGFIYDINGHVITNAHVVGSAREVSVTLGDGQVVKAKVRLTGGVEHTHVRWQAGTGQPHMPHHCC
jgi:hypothetical protein